MPSCGLGFLSVDGPYRIEEFPEWNHRVNLVTTFLAGAFIHHWRLALTAQRAIGCAVVSILTLLYGGFWLTLPTCFSYLVIYVALGPFKLPDMARYGDLSYGIYIYAWPVKQLLVQSAIVTGWFGVATAATVIVLALAALSWHLIEKKALTFKGRLVPGESSLSQYFDHAASALHGGAARLLRLSVRPVSRTLAPAAKDRVDG